MIIGLTGTKASGKGIIAEILKEKGFVYSSTSDRVREEAEARKIINYVIKDLQDIGNDLRERFGTDILVKRTLKKLKDAKDSVIDGIRNLGEIEELKKQGAIIIGVDAPQEQRFERILKRGRQSDPKDLKGFLKMEKRDLGEGEKNSGQQTAKCIEAADYKIMNNGTLEELKQKIEYFLMSLENKQGKKENQTIVKREDYISWDEYFMGVALFSAQRSKDPNTQVGACIVDKKNHIVATGYNGFPIGCSDDNLPWQREGDKLDTKYAYVVHAELNAILNSTKDLENCKIYVGLFPCNECAKAIIQSGIKEVIYLSDKYANLDMTKAAKKMFNQAGIRLRQFIPKHKNLTIDFDKKNQ